MTGDIRDQTSQAPSNPRTVLEGANATLAALLKLTVFLRDMDDLEGFNQVYRTRIPDLSPSRSVVEVSEFALPGIDVEVEAVARRP